MHVTWFIWFFQVRCSSIFTPMKCHVTLRYPINPERGQRWRVSWMRSITSFTANDKVPANPRSLPPVLENFHRPVSPHILLAQKLYSKKAKETVIRNSRRTQSALKKEELNAYFYLLNVDLSFADLSLILKNEGYFLTIFSAAGSRSEDNSNSSNRWVILTINCLAGMKTLVLGNLFKLSRFSWQIRTCRWPRGKSEKKKWTCIFPIRQCHFNFAQKLESCTR